MTATSITPLSFDASPDVSPDASHRAELDALWMPFTANKAFKARPRMLVRAEGMYYTSDDGRAVLDGTAGLWCVNAGHCRPEIIAAISEAAATLDYAPGFQLGHPASFELATRLAALLPDGIDRVFFTNSGSEAVDTALKIALAYQVARGEPQRTRFVGRERSYHGVGFGGISAGGIEVNKRAFASQLLPHVSHLPHTHDIARNAFSRGQPQHGAHLADALESIITEHGAHTIAAVIVEPLAGSTGVLVPPVGYLERLRAMCDAHDLLLIFDEVITGFGRLGAAFGAQRFGVTPDIMAIAKGLTNAAVPMGATCVSRRIHDTVVGATERGIELFHGYTYSGHPLATAAGLATLNILERDQLFARAASMAPIWEQAVHALRDAPHVIDIRNYGLVAGIELAPRAEGVGLRGNDVFVNCFFEQNMMVRFTGDTIAMSPPLIVSEDEIAQLMRGLRRALERVN